MPTLLRQGRSWRSSGRAGLAVVPSMPIRLRSLLRTMSNRATPAVHRPGAPLHATRQAAGAPSAGSQSSNHPSRDRADGATLGSLRSGGDSEGRRPGTPISADFPTSPARPTRLRTSRVDSTTRLMADTDTSLTGATLGSLPTGGERSPSPGTPQPADHVRRPTRRPVVRGPVESEQPETLAGKDA